MNRSDPTLLINILAPEADMITESVSEYAEIAGSRTNHPRFGAHSDITVEFCGKKHGPFSYYADAYDFALTLAEPQQILRGGRVARKPASKR